MVKCREFSGRGTGGERRGAAPTYVFASACTVTIEMLVMPKHIYD